MINLNYLTDRTLYQMFKIIFIISSKTQKATDNLSIRIYVNKIKSRITFKVKPGYYLELLTPEMMKLLRSTKNKIIKNENGKNVPHLEIAEPFSAHCNIANNDY